MSVKKSRPVTARKTSRRASVEADKRLAAKAEKLKAAAPTRTPARATEIFTDDFQSAEDAEVLRRATAAYLQRVTGANIPAPESVIFVDDGTLPVFTDNPYGPSGISTRFPLYRDYSTGRKTKTAEESVALNLHEVTHQLLRDAIRSTYANQPEIQWAFFTRVDSQGEYASREMIEGTKAQTRFANETTDSLMERFGRYTNVADAYGELIADLGPSAHLGDPDAIFKSIHFEQAESTDPYALAETRAEPLRRFLYEPTEDQVAGSLNSDPYAVLSSTRKFLWERIVEPQIAAHPESQEQLLIRVLKASVASLVEVTENFSKAPATIEVAEMNRNFRRHLETEFGVT